MGTRRGLVRALIAAAACALGAACATSQPIYNVIDAPVGSASRQLSANEVQNAIQRAGASLGWNIQADAPGRLTGRYALRGHFAVVDIQHDARSYSIRYRDSVNLSAQDGMIHSGYNQWVQSLERAIRSQLLAL